MVQKKQHAVVETFEEEPEAPEAGAEDAAEPAEPRKPRNKTSRKEELKRRVAKTKAFEALMQNMRKAASKIPRKGEDSGWEDERIAVKAVGYPVLMRSADPECYYDTRKMANLARTAGSKIVHRVNKKGVMTEAVVRPRANDAAMALILNIAMTRVAGFMRSSQEYVAMSRRKNLAARDVKMAMRRYTRRFVISRPDSQPSE
jgi:hypothetical protein